MGGLEQLTSQRYKEYRCETLGRATCRKGRKGFSHVEDLKIILSPWNQDCTVDDIEKIHTAFSKQTTRKLHKSMLVLSTAIEIMNTAMAVGALKRKHADLVRELKSTGIPADDVGVPSMKDWSGLHYEQWSAIANNYLKVVAKSSDDVRFARNHQDDLDVVASALEKQFVKISMLAWESYIEAFGEISEAVGTLLGTFRPNKDKVQKVCAGLQQLFNKAPNLESVKLTVLAKAVKEDIRESLAEKVSLVVSWSTTLCSCFETWTSTDEHHSAMVESYRILAALATNQTTLQLFKVCRSDRCESKSYQRREEGVRGGGDWLLERKGGDGSPQTPPPFGV
jgi:hypothetical protein